MKTLLELSYQNYHGSDDDLPEEIPWKIRNLAKEKIKNTLQNHQTKYILQVIYLFRTIGVTDTIRKIVGSFDNYQGGVWRIAVLHACCSYIFTPPEDRLIDIIDTMNNYLPDTETEKTEQILEKVLVMDQNDLSNYIQIYQLFGKFLLP